MTKRFRVAAASGLLFSLFLSFGLETAGWLFYELSHLTDAKFLYTLYSLFRGGDYLLTLQSHSWVIYIGAGFVLASSILVISSLVTRALP